MEKNLTQGSILKNIISFSLPFLFSYFLQTLYGMADLFIAGQYNGAEVITAISVGSQIMHMLTVIIVGLAAGGSILISQAVGAKDEKTASKVTGNTITLFFVLSVFLTFILLISTKRIIRLVSTPKESIEQTFGYLQICFTGIPFVIFYKLL